MCQIWLSYIDNDQSTYLTVLFGSTLITLYILRSIMSGSALPNLYDSWLNCLQSSINQGNLITFITLVYINIQ